jgi:hypothetical protein
MLVPSPQFGKVVTPTDTTTTLFQDGPARGFYIGGAGTITIQHSRANPDTCQYTVPAGYLLPVAGVRVAVTGTSATLIVALY